MCPPRPVPDLIGVCWDSEEHIWFEVDRVGESCPEDSTEVREHNVTYYQRVESQHEVDRRIAIESSHEGELVP